MNTKKPTNTKDLPHHLIMGQFAETLAIEYLQKRGLALLHHQYRLQTGEIDIVMKEKQEIVFVEVRYREKLDPVDPLETITIQKQQRIIRSALHFLQYRHWTDSYSKRFDVITILGDKLKPKITWIKDAFQVQ